MKALILAAGHGTRLLPHTRHIPKPLFRLSGKPVLQIMIEKLIASGCEQIFVNTHHLHDKIEVFINESTFPVPVTAVYEPDILGTGGAIANLKEELSTGPFMVVNSDIITDIDFRELRDFHNRGDQLATLALHDCPEFNKIEMDDNGSICSFQSKSGKLAFTGIQVLSPRIFDYLPDTKNFSSIDLYSGLMGTLLIKGLIFNNISWIDIGTPKAYTMACLKEFATRILKGSASSEIDIQQIAGDGSDRNWYRIQNQTKSYIVSDHGIGRENAFDSSPYQAFIQIGNHLHTCNLPVPRIIEHDPFSGLVVLEDLGNVHLEQLIKTISDADDILFWYQKVCKDLYRFSQTGIQNFNPEWTCQTRHYDKSVIIEKECQYFVNEFLVNYLKLDVGYDEFEAEFNYIADNALEHGFKGLMHRDFQSRNIMIKDNDVYFIDFQSARIGPIQYDLASLLIDPYVDLPQDIQEKILVNFHETFIPRGSITLASFKHSFLFCCLTRNLQILGAFSFLTLTKKKIYFEKYIPSAVKSLKLLLDSVGRKRIPKLYGLIQNIGGSNK